MPNPTYIPARIQHRMGKRQDLPQPLMPGEIGFCVDTDQVFIGSDPDDTSGYASPVIHVYSDFVEAINNGSYLDTAYENTYIYVVNKILEKHLFVIDLDEGSEYPSINEAYDNTTDSSFMVKVEYEQIDQFGVSVNIKRAYIGVKSFITQPNTYPDITGVATMIGDFAGFTGSKLDMSSTINGGLSFDIKDTSALVNVINWVFDNSSEFSSVMSNGKSIVTMGQNVELLTDRNKTFNEELKVLMIPLKAGTNVKTGIWFSQYDSDCYDIKYSIKSMNYLRSGELSFGMILNQSDLSDRYSEMTLNDNFTQDVVFKVISVTESNNTAFELLYDADGLEDNTELSINIERWRSFKDALPPPPIQVVPTFQVSSATSVDEGEEILFDVTSTNFGTGVMYWTIQPTSRSEDFTSIGGSFTIANDQGSFSLTPSLDSLTEGDETFEVVIRAESQTGTIVAKSQVITINDTSTTPNPTFNIIPSTSNVNEGSSVNFTVTTTDFSDSRLYWIIDTNQAESADFDDMNGFVDISNNSGSFSITPKADLITEGPESFVVILKTGSVSGVEVARTGSITINDTSTTPRTINAVPNVTTAPENSVVTFSVTTTNFGTGTLYWIRVPNRSQLEDAGIVSSGEVQITNNVGSMDIIAQRNPSIQPENETFSIVYRFDQAQDGNIDHRSPIINIVTSSYLIIPSSNSINEGDSITFDIAGSNVPDATLYWNVVSSGNILSSDFDGGLSGTVELVNDSGSWVMTASEDLETEGNETFTVQLRTGSNSGAVVASSPTITINDTSTTPSPTYSVVPNKTSINEGESVTFDVSTTNFPDGPLYWVVSAGSSASLQDFNGSTAGLVNVVNGSGSWSMVASQDNITEGNESFTVQIRTGSQNGTTVATSSSVTINDTSTTPASPTYSVTPNVTSINEGDTVRFDVSTTNAPETQLLWFLTSPSQTNEDDFDGSLSGTVTLSNGSGSWTMTASEDLLTEGNESFTVQLRASTTTGVLATSSSVTINDTSTTPASPTYSVTPNVTSINEGESVTFDVATTNFPDGPLYWTIDEQFGPLTSDDFGGGPISGSVNITNNSGQVTMTTSVDSITEEPETFSLQIRTGSTSGPVVATSESVNIINVAPAGGGGGCLLPHVLITMADGSVKRADEVNVGDQLLGATFDGMLDESDPEWREWTTDDISSFTTSVSTVKAVKYDSYGEYYIINDNLHITISHRIFVNDGSSWAWKDVNFIKVGDKLINALGEEITIDVINKVTETVEVVDFDVEDTDTYFAGEYLVHNADDKQLAP